MLPDTSCIIVKEIAGSTGKKLKRQHILSRAAFSQLNCKRYLNELFSYKYGKRDLLRRA